MDRGADPNQTGFEGVTLLIIASENGYLKIVEILLNDKRTNLNQSYKKGQMPTSGAYWYGQVEILELLLAQGAKPDYSWNSPDAKECTLLLRAYKSYQTVLKTNLTDFVADINHLGISQIVPKPPIPPLNNAISAYLIVEALLHVLVKESNSFPISMFNQQVRMNQKKREQTKVFALMEEISSTDAEYIVDLRDILFDKLIKKLRQTSFKDIAFIQSLEELYMNSGDRLEEKGKHKEEKEPLSKHAIYPDYFKSRSI